uniref:Uncharacterized protein n=1 Tax=Populus trichocarpa TaxID=3694 RepID=A0A2K2BNT5_POPTR
MDLAPKTLGFGLRPYPNPFGVRTGKDPNPLGSGPTPQPNPYWVWTRKDSNPNPTPLGPDMHPAPNPIGSGHGVSLQPILGPDREGPKPILGKYPTPPNPKSPWVCTQPQPILGPHPTPTHFGSRHGRTQIPLGHDTDPTRTPLGQTRTHHPTLLIPATKGTKP